MDIRKILDIITEKNVSLVPKYPAFSLSEFLLEAEQLDEKLKGVSARPYTKDELAGQLDRIIHAEKEKKEKFKYPYIHKSNIPVLNGIQSAETGQQYDLKAFYKLITGRPTRILKQNEKMKHSDGSSSVFYNIGLPAIKGLVGDEEKGPPDPNSIDGGASSFLIVNTCPGAGECMIVCYATKGGYVQWKASSLGQTRMINFLYNDPEGFAKQLESEISHLKGKNKKGNEIVVRWHDSGDFFSPEYYNLANKLAKKFPDITFYAYTKVADIFLRDHPDNFVFNFSSGATKKQEKHIDFSKHKHSRIVVKTDFSEYLQKDKKGKWQYKNKEAENKVKQNIAKKFDVKPNTLLTYDEYMKIPRSNEIGKYNVIIKPGDGDVAASRRDVLGSYLLIH